MANKRKCNQEIISSYLDNELLPEERSVLKQHIESCEACAKTYNNILTVSQGLRSLKRLVPSANLVMSVMKQLQAIKAKNQETVKKLFQFWGLLILSIAIGTFIFGRVSVYFLYLLIKKMGTVLSVLIKMSWQNTLQPWNFMMSAFLIAIAILSFYGFYRTYYNTDK